MYKCLEGLKCWHERTGDSIGGVVLQLIHTAGRLCQLLSTSYWLVPVNILHLFHYEIFQYFKTFNMHLSGIHIKITEERLVVFSGPHQSIAKLRDADSSSWRGIVGAQALGILLLPVHHKWDYTFPDRHIGLCSTQLEVYENVVNEDDCRKVWPALNGKTKPSSPTICILVVQARHNKAEKRDVHRSCAVWVALESFQQCIWLSGVAPPQGESSPNSIFH